MLTLGLESTCDETSCAVVKDGKVILSNVIASQGDLHENFGGVIPELASRRHLDAFPILLKEALMQAGVTLQDIELIAVARGPGLMGSLLVGLHFAKGLSLSTGIPFVGVNHVEAHLFTALADQEVLFPALGVVVSGGHTALLLIPEKGSYVLLGQTQDDAIGEAFDKVASLLGLPYPGGPHVEKMARRGDPSAYPFKPGRTKARPFDFSFSGLKTGVLYLIKGQNGHAKGPDQLTEEEKRNVAASFQHCALSDVVNKSLLAAKQYQCQSILIGGGVSQNSYLRTLFNCADLPVFWPHQGLSADNGAMIAQLGFYTYQKQGCGDPFDLEAQPRIPLGGIPCVSL